MASLTTGMITLFTGENQLELHEAIHALRQELDPSEIATSVFDPPHDLQAIRAAIRSPGFFGSTRLVIVRRLLSAVSMARRSSLDESLLDILATCPETTHLVLLEPVTLDTRVLSALKQRIPNLEVTVFSIPRGQALLRWVVQRAERYQATISPQAAEHLVAAVCPWGLQSTESNSGLQPDLVRLDQELAKLATAALPERHITDALVRQLVAAVEPEHGWALLNAFERHDLAGIIREIEHELDQGTPPERLLAQIVTQLELYLQVRAAGQHAETALASAGISAGRLRHAIPAARRFPDTLLHSLLEQLRQLDLASKLGPVDVGAGLLSILGTAVSRTT